MTTAGSWAILGATQMDADLRSLLTQNNLMKGLGVKQVFQHEVADPEPFGLRETFAMLIIFAGVALVKRLEAH